MRGRRELESRVGEGRRPRPEAKARVEQPRPLRARARAFAASACADAQACLPPLPLPAVPVARGLRLSRPSPHGNGARRRLRSGSRALGASGAREPRLLASPVCAAEAALAPAAVLGGLLSGGEGVMAGSLPPDPFAGSPPTPKSLFLVTLER